MTGVSGPGYAAPELWIMTALAGLAGTQAFTSAPPVTGIEPVVLGPSLCFTFAILLSWGLAPAIVAQTLAVAVVAWRLRRPFPSLLVALGGNVVALTAAEAVLRLDPPDPVHYHDVARLTTDALVVLGAAAAWLITYSVFAILVARLVRRGPRRMPARDIVTHHVLFRAALLMLSPLLAIAIHMNAAFVILVFIPLYAVQHMAKLSAHRDEAARRDPLTGLANRAGLKAGFSLLTAVQDGQTGGRTAILLADLDEFKHVNDALGHDVGDQLLVAVAERLSGLHPAGGTVARLGGDEFAIVTPVTALTDVDDLAERVLSALRAPVALDGLRIGVAASVGTAVRANGEDFSTVMRHADIAMYDAKHRGGTATAYQPGVHHDSVERLALLADLRHALDNPGDTEITVYYQPQIDLATGGVGGVEALLRWRHPIRGPIDTGTLIAMAEHSDVIHRLTRRVIDDTVTQVGRWTAVGMPIRASINVSARDLYADDIVDHLADCMARHQVEPKQIQIEITESALMADPRRATATVERISALGVAISLDDFGTGYSSLQHLRRMPIAEIKIDRSFVAGMATSHDDAAIVASTIGLARSLGIRTVAEGVENTHTRDLLDDAGCTLIQGYLTGRPMLAADLTAWLADQRIG